MFILFVEKRDSLFEYDINELYHTFFVGVLIIFLFIRIWLMSNSYNRKVIDKILSLLDTK